MRTNAPEILEQVTPRLPAGWRPSPRPVVDRLLSLLVGGGGERPGARRFHVLYGDTMRLARSFDMEDVLRTIEVDLELYVASAARRRIFLHAGVVGWRGRALLLPGASGSGKSTLVAALVRAGAIYYSDEYALLDGTGRVHPYPRPLQMRDDEGRNAPLPVDALGGRAGRRPLPVGLVALTRYAPRARWRPHGLGPGRAMLELVAHALPVRLRPEATLAALGQALAGAIVLEGTRGAADETAARMLATLGAPHAPIDEGL